MITSVYEYEHIKKIASGMVKRYGDRMTATRECQRNIDSPLTTDAGKRFWSLVREEIENVVESRRLKTDAGNNHELVTTRKEDLK